MSGLQAVCQGWSRHVVALLMYWSNVIRALHFVGKVVIICLLPRIVYLPNNFQKIIFLFVYFCYTPKHTHKTLKYTLLYLKTNKHTHTFSLIWSVFIVSHTCKRNETLQNSTTPSLYPPYPKSNPSPVKCACGTRFEM